MAVLHWPCGGLWRSVWVSIRTCYVYIGVPPLEPSPLCAYGIALQLRASLHGLLEAIANLMGVATGNAVSHNAHSLALLCLYCWRLALQSTDNEFLQGSSVFSTLRDVISRAESQQWKVRMLPIPPVHRAQCLQR
jgi:hypothetical protein